ncbi:proline--tRNA ligase [Candidatus Nitrosocosmicus franklandus]|uniref:proline--tRNA ligase n=1 Tax=Candidatus Nitrosocosmicus franklandianus TaxID=1798806 RepID=UPI003CC816EF
MNKEFGLTVKKNENFSEWYSQVIEKAGLADYISAKGFIIVRPYGYAIWELIKEYLDKKFKETGHVNGFLPCLIPEGLLNKEEKHFRGFNPEVFWVTSSGDTPLAERLALRPTSEALLYSIFPKWISSYRDLPLRINFWNTALRAEIKSTKPFIRNSEFLWQEGHTAHIDNEGAKEQVIKILSIYKQFIENVLLIPTISGFKSNKEKFVGADYTTTLEGMMPDGKALQLGTSHNLGRNFSQPFEIKFLNSNNKEEFVWQTSWGISWRLIGALIMVHGDDKGLILPPVVAPIQIIIIPIYKDQNQELVKKHANSLKNQLSDLGYRVFVDERDEFTAGWKYNEWEMKGVPIRINIGQRDIEKNTIEIVRRDNRQKKLIPLNTVSAEIKETFKMLESDLYKNALRFLQDMTHLVENINDFKLLLDKGRGGFLVTNWCGNEDCEERIKEDTGADIRVLPFDIHDLPIKIGNGAAFLTLRQCVYCRQESNQIAVFARAY